MAVIHHSAICVRNVDESLRFWRDGIGFQVTIDRRFEGDWPTLLGAPSTTLRSIFLGDPDAPDAGIVELVELGEVGGPPAPEDAARAGFLLLSVVCDLQATLSRLADLHLGGAAKTIEASGIAMAVVTDPDGVAVELIDAPAAGNLRRLADRDRKASVP